MLQADKDDPEMKKFFKDKIVYIGSTATGAHDFRNTPIDTKLPGVYAHMNLTEMLLQQYFYQPVDDSIVYSLYILGIAMVLLMGFMMFNKAILDIFVLALISGMIFALDYY